ncbi:MAG: discoidin domain-containing protein [Candidatus Dadabacteria bacterium]|nr:MAG: discoidin domain-containing protein [Candidatus Dadabacteria bacterium]
MKRYLTYSNISFLALIILMNYGLFLLLPNVFLVDSPGFLFARLPDGWFNLVDTGSNAYLKWRVDPFLSKFLPPLSTKQLFFVLSAILESGLFLFLTIHLGENRIYSLFASSIFTPIFLAIFGLNTIIFAPLVWLPWLFICAQAYGEKGSLLPFLCLLFVSIRSIQTANFLSIFPSIAVLLVLSQKHNSTSPFRAYVTASLLILLPLLSLLSIPTPYFPSYADTGHLVPDDTVAGHIRPLWGPGYNLPVIDRIFIRKVALIPSLVLTLFGAIGMQLKCYRLPYLFKVSFILSVLTLLLTSAVPESVSQISPLAALSRLVPGLFLLSPALVFMALSLVLYALSAKPNLFVAGATVISVAIWAILGERVSLPLTARENRHAPFISLSRDVKNRYSLEDILVSPSYNLIHREGYNILKLRHIPPLKRVHISKFKALVTASNRPDLLINLWDRNPATRWKSGGAKQTGNEWIHIKLKEPQKIGGVALKTGNFHSDFPRGLRISYKEDCSGDKSEFAHYKEAIEFKDWEGSIKFTKKGYPYYTPPAVVAVKFYAPVTTSCILIEQTGHTNRYDWSVTGLYLFIPK